MPDDLSPDEAAPLLCAGITTFNALCHSGARGGERVAILGVGAVTWACSSQSSSGSRRWRWRGEPDKEELARKLGAHHHIDSTTGDPGQALADLGGTT